jgi:F-type H+-transporting ATPase subunit alpha
VAGPLRLDMAQYRALAVFAKFSSEELDKASRDQLARGERITEVLKQKQYSPMPVTHQVISLYTAVHGFLDDIAVEKVSPFLLEYLRSIKSNNPEIEVSIDQKKQIDEETAEKLNKSVCAFKEAFVSQEKALTS